MYQGLFELIVQVLHDRVYGVRGASGGFLICICVCVVCALARWVLIVSIARAHRMRVCRVKFE